MDRLRRIFFLTAAFLLTAPVVALADFKNPLEKQGIDSIAGFTEAFLKAVTFILFPIAVVFVVYSGFLFIFAQGNTDQLAKAKKNFLWTVVGVTLLLGAWALAMLIRGTLEPILQ